MHHRNDAIDIFLQPGEFFVGDASYRVKTLLGSCVSVTVWHPKMRIGAMTHFLLSARDGPVSELDARYGEEAMWLTLRDLVRADVHPLECEAKIFGGGNMFPRQARHDALNVGRRNGETAHRLLRNYGIPIVAQSLYGVGHRQIIFDVATGDVWVRRVKPVEAAASASKVSA